MKDLPGRGWSILSSYILDAPDPVERKNETVRIAGYLFAAAGLLALLTTILPGSDTIPSDTGLTTAGVIGVVIALVLVSAPYRVDPWMLLVFAVLGVVNISFGIYSAGPSQFVYGAMLYPWVTSIGFLAGKRRWNILLVGLIGICYGIVLALYEQPAAANVWTFTMLTITVTGSVVSWLVQHGHRLALAERAAKREAETARATIAQMNEDLEDRVARQVKEVEQLGKLRSFLSANVAEAIVSSEELMKPHRREIAVFFADLRGFTSFASQAEPEEVMDVLEGFYQVTGDLFARYDATIGDFAGDGVMAFFNDPLPVPDPALRAVEVALELRPPMAAALTRWHD